jgi:maleate cis-trans isomerase
MSEARRIGLIIPSANRLTEPQFHAYLPATVAFHVTRLRMAGKFRKPLKDLEGPLTEAAEALSDVRPDLIVFHCTANSMENGLAHEQALIKIIERAAGCSTITTAQAITQAFDRCRIKRLVLISPYVQATNQLEVDYLRESGYSVIHAIGLGLDGHAYASVTPEEWKRVARQNARPDADGYFLSCTNTRMIEAVADLEREFRKPVINSNQATIWACLQRLGIPHADPRLGRLFERS